MSTIGEFGIIERFFTRQVDGGQCRLGIGDDAAIIDAAGPLAIAMDTLVEGVHFPAELDPSAIGHRALAVNLSDLAAMGARARWTTLALTLGNADPKWLEKFATGFFALADRYDVLLIGGDTTRGPLTITVEIIGDAPERPLLRSAGKPGDQLFVTGTLGDSAAALEQFAHPVTERSDDARALIERFSYPEPRLDFGLALAAIGGAAIDVSDGLLADLAHVCQASACGAVIEPARLPLSATMRSLYSADTAAEFALRGGDDYELCFAVDPSVAERVLAAAGDTNTPVTRIGMLTDETGIHAETGTGRVELQPAGFRHF